MPIPVWDNPAFKFIVRDSRTRADTVGSAAGGILLAIVTNLVGIGGGQMLPANEFIRAVVIAVAGFGAIWAVIFLARAFFWPFHKNREKLGRFMWPVVLMAAGFFSFVLLSGGGLVWLVVQAARGPLMATIEGGQIANNDAPIKATPAQPELSILPPKDRYTFQWDPTGRMDFNVQREGYPLPPGPGNTANPAFILHNSSRTAAAEVVIKWDAEISNIKELAKVGHLSKYDIRFPDEFTMLLFGAPPVPNFQYNPNRHAEYKFQFVARDAELFLPIGIYPILGLFIAANMPNELGAKTEPFPISIEVSWNFPDGGQPQRFAVKIRGVNTKPAGITSPPEVNGYLDFEISKK